jgi:hypothetical protein
MRGAWGRSWRWLVMRGGGGGGVFEPFGGLEIHAGVVSWRPSPLPLPHSFCQPPPRRVIHHGLQKPQRQRWSATHAALQNTTENLFQISTAQRSTSRITAAYPHPEQPPKTNPHSVPKPASRAPLASRRRRPASRASGFKAAASLPPPAAARSMSCKSGAPKCRWVGPQGHSLLIGIGLSGIDYFVVDIDQVSRRRLCQRCC